jgi:hypothetical protein
MVLLRLEQKTRMYGRVSSRVVVDDDSNRTDNTLFCVGRAPLVPKHVKELVEKGHTVVVEPSTTRAYVH